MPKLRPTAYKTAPRRGRFGKRGVQARFNLTRWLRIASRIALTGSVLSAAALVCSITFRSALIASSGVLNADRFRTGALTWLIVMTVSAAASTLLVLRNKAVPSPGAAGAPSALVAAEIALERAGKTYSPVRELELAAGQIEQMRSQRDTLESILSASTSPEAWPDLHRLFDAMEGAMSVNCKKLATYAVNDDRHSMKELLSRNSALLEQAAEANRKVTILVAEEQGVGDTDLKIRSYLETLDAQVQELEFQ